MQDSIMAQIGMEHEQHHNNGHHQDGSFASADGWVDLNQNYHHGSQAQSPMYEHPGFAFMQPMPHNLPHDTQYAPHRMSQPPPQPVHTTHQQLLPLIMPSHPTWPSMLTNPINNYSPPVPIPASAPPLVKGHATTTHTAPTPRKTLTDSDRRRMCQYHEDNPSVKQTEIGAMFGVERSTVSKVLRQREKYLFPDDRSSSPLKRAKGKFPDIERALANWAKNNQKHGVKLTDAAIKEKARFFATTVGNNESHIKTNSSTWLEKFKQKNGIGVSKLTRRASETNISDSGSLNPDSASNSAAQTPNGISPTSPIGLLPSPSPLSATKSEEDLKSGGDNINGYFGHANSFRHANSQSTTSLNSAFNEAAPSSSFSTGPGSPTTSFSFSPDTWMPQSRMPPQGGAFQRPRSQTFPMLGIDPSFIASQPSEPSTPKFNMPVTAPSSALDSPSQEIPPPYGMESTISPPPLHHSSSNGSMAPPSSTTPITGLHSPPGSSAPGSPTQDDARRALDTLLNFFQQAPNGLVDQNEYMTVVKLTEKLRLQSNAGPLPGGLHRIAEQDYEIAPKMEQSMSAGC